MNHKLFYKKINRAYVQSLLIYETETWPMKAENLHGLERTEAELMMVRWMCGVSLKNRRLSEDLYSLLRYSECSRCGETL